MQAGAGAVTKRGRDAIPYVILLVLTFALLHAAAAKAEKADEPLDWKWGRGELQTDLQNLLACITWINVGELQGSEGPDPSEFWKGCAAAAQAPGSSPQLKAANKPSDFPRFEFAVGSDRLPLHSHEHLNTIEALALLLGRPTTRSVQIRLVGHASCLKDEADSTDETRNLRLSLQRARFMRLALVSNNYTRNHAVSGHRIVTEGRGFFERRNGGDFKDAECKVRAESVLGSAESNEELLQQRVEVRVESPLLVRWGLGATGQTVGRLVHDKRDPQDALLPRGFPKGLWPGIYHSLDLSGLHPAFRLPAGLPRECWTRATRWISFKDVSSQNSDGAPLDGSDLGVLSLRVRTVVTQTPEGRHVSVVLDVTGRIPSWGEGEPIPPLLAKTILSLPAYWALEERLSYVLSPILTLSASDIASGIDNLPNPTDDTDAARKLQFYQVLAHKVGHMTCQPLVASMPKDSVEGQLREALHTLLQSLPQTHEDMLARLSGIHPQLGFSPVRVGERICVHPARLFSVTNKVEYGWSSESCAHVVNVGVAGQAPLLQMSSADNGFPQRYGSADQVGDLPFREGTHIRWARTWAEGFMRPLPRRAVIQRPIEGLLKGQGNDAPFVFNDENPLRSFMLIGYTGESAQQLRDARSYCAGKHTIPAPDPQCVTIPFGGELRVQIPAQMAKGRTFWDLGITIGELGDITGRTGSDVLSAVHKIKAFRSTFATGAGLVIDRPRDLIHGQPVLNGDTDLIRRFPVINGDVLPW
jgi:outer membrane protein OmpA-like peptidoglycan-associated protein